jgi:hypothetical protein
MLDLKIIIIKGIVIRKCHCQKVCFVLFKYSSLFFTWFYVMTVAYNGVSCINCKSICSRTVVLNVGHVALRHDFV